MSKFIAGIARFFRPVRSSPSAGRAELTLRDPAWLVRSSGWAAVPALAAREARRG